jgi:hypothetical protein
MSFGLDYQHQSSITSSISHDMELYIKDGFDASSYSNWVNSLKVEFEKASASSLDLVIEIHFTGEAAEKYLEIPRLLQSFTIDACNKNSWVIPFNQITVHTV